MSSQAYKPFYVEYTCDGVGCQSEERFDLEDDGWVDWGYFNTELKEQGWITRKIDGDWMHFCSRTCWKSVIDL